VVSLRQAELGTYEFQAFGYRMRRSDLRLGLEPVAVVALDSAGSEIARQTTGFAG
jgi:hypothetical protein